MHCQRIYKNPEFKIHEQKNASLFYNFSNGIQEQLIII